MLEALLISNAILWVAVIGLAALVAALVRQIGVLHERVAPAGALLGREGPRLGEPAPQLALADWNGAPVRIGGADAARRATLLLFVSPTCPVCKTMLEIASALMRDEGRGARLVLASDGAREEHAGFVAAHGLAERTYVLSTELGLAYEVGKLPYAALIDADGVLRAKGLVNTREHLESLFEAMRLGVGSVQEYLRPSASPQFEHAPPSPPFEPGSSPPPFEQGGPGGISQHSSPRRL
ncbi:MAG: methylamine dehydrogenase accessory protein MauD [Deltaproteobacteria bacterium]|nr:methylamine dehydrogenase accessory protein MauD [Deltaproteobacteria bacterium]